MCVLHETQASDEGPGHLQSLKDQKVKKVKRLRTGWGLWLGRLTKQRWLWGDRHQSLPMLPFFDILFSALVDAFYHLLSSTLQMTGQKTRTRTRIAGWAELASVRYMHQSDFDKVYPHCFLSLISFFEQFKPFKKAQIFRKIWIAQLRTGPGPRLCLLARQHWHQEIGIKVYPCCCCHSLISSSQLAAKTAFTITSYL